MGYYKTILRAGRTIEVHKSFTKREGKRVRGGRSTPTVDEMEKVNQSTAVRKLTTIINTNFKADDHYITLTYKKDERPSPIESKDNIKKLINDLRKSYKKYAEEFKYIHVTEYKNKSIHHHLIINDSNSFGVAKMIRKLWDRGRPQLKLIDDTGQYKDLADYLIKETAKTFKENEGGHKQRYSCSRNLTRPLPKTKYIKKAVRWSADPKPTKGYYIDQDTIHNGINPFTGREYQRYTLVKIQPNNS